MHVLDWVSDIPVTSHFRTMSVLSIGESVNQFAPNLTVLVRNLEKNESLARHFDVSKMVESAKTTILEQRDLNIGSKVAILQRVESVAPGGTPIDQITLYFIVPPKAIVVTLSAARNTAGMHETTLQEFVKNFALVEALESS